MRFATEYSLRIYLTKTQGQYKGLINTFGRVLQAEGVRGVFGGLPPVLLFTIPAHALYFFGYETSKRMFEPDKSVEEKSVSNRA